MGPERRDFTAEASWFKVAPCQGQDSGCLVAGSPFATPGWHPAILAPRRDIEAAGMGGGAGSSRRGGASLVPSHQPGGAWHKDARCCCGSLGTCDARLAGRTLPKTPAKVAAPQGNGSRKRKRAGGGRGGGHRLRSPPACPLLGSARELQLPRAGDRPSGADSINRKQPACPAEDEAGREGGEAGQRCLQLQAKGQPAPLPASRQAQ